MSGTPEAPKCESVQDVKAHTGIEKEKLEKKRKYFREYMKKWNKSPEQKEKKKVHDKAYRLANKEKIYEYKKQYRKDHPRSEYDSARKYKKTHPLSDLQKEKNRACILLWKKNNPHKRHDYRRRARCAKKSSVVEKFSSIDIYNRDNWVCGLCHIKVDKKLKYPDPMSASLDHIVPLACGGSHTKDNVQLAHWICNVKAKTGGTKQLLLPI